MGCSRSKSQKPSVHEPDRPVNRTKAPCNNIPGAAKTMQQRLQKHVDQSGWDSDGWVQSARGSQSPALSISTEDQTEIAEDEFVEDPAATHAALILQQAGGSKNSIARTASEQAAQDWKVSHPQERQMIVQGVVEVRSMLPAGAATVI